MTSRLASAIRALASHDSAARRTAAETLYAAGRHTADRASEVWWSDAELGELLLAPAPRVTVGVAVAPETFARIREANGKPRLSDVPPDQDVMEFELQFPNGKSLDVLTTRETGGKGAMARFLAKFGEGVQQVEFRCRNVDRATEILHDRFGIGAIYPQTRPGADGKRVNFFLVPSPDGGKVLIELYEPPNQPAAAR